MESIDFLIKNSNKWFKTAELTKVENCTRYNVLRKLQKIYNSKMRFFYGLERSYKNINSVWSYYWRIKQSQNPKGLGIYKTR